MRTVNRGRSSYSWPVSFDAWTSERILLWADFSKNQLRKCGHSNVVQREFQRMRIEARISCPKILWIWLWNWQFAQLCVFTFGAHTCTCTLNCYSVDRALLRKISWWHPCVTWCVQVYSFWYTTGRKHQCIAINYCAITDPCKWRKKLLHRMAKTPWH